MRNYTRYKTERERKAARRASCKKYRQTHKKEQRLAHLKYSETHKETIIKRSHNWHLKSKYGITLNDFEQMSVNQFGKCPICHKQFEDDWDTCVDHNHDTNTIRSLLCRKCNFLIGNAKEDVNVLENAINYLNKWNQCEV